MVFAATDKWTEVLVGKKIVAARTSRHGMSLELEDGVVVNFDPGTLGPRGSEIVNLAVRVDGKGLLDILVD